MRGKGLDQLACRLLRAVAVLGVGATLAAVAALNAKASSRDAIFRRVLQRAGKNGAPTYRIPGLAVTPAGTLVAVFDIRRRGPGDLPGDIDVGARRSTDGGRTWGALQLVLDFPFGAEGAMGNGVGDPAVLVDRRTGHLLVAALWSPGDRAWNGSRPGLSPEKTGQLVLARSVDDGRSWSPPVNLTGRIAGRDPGWRLLFQGPGSGIQLRDGTLLFAAQFRDAQGEPRSGFIASIDGGASWRVSAPAIPLRPPTSEAQLAELPDGSLLISMRDESRSGRRAWARYDWRDDLFRGAWSEPWFTVADPTCQASLVRHPGGALYFTNPGSADRRVALTVRTSRDGGRSWSAGRVLDPRPCAYSCLAVLADGSLGVVYECGEASPYETLAFARFPPGWPQGRASERGQSDGVRAKRAVVAYEEMAEAIHDAGSVRAGGKRARRDGALVWNSGRDPGSGRPAGGG